MMIVDVLGTAYSVKESNKIEDLNLENNDGYCDYTTKTIVIDTFQDSPGSLEDLDEEIVDWIAYQFPKMMKAFEASNSL